ncbi:hypothetical protein [Arthrobacter psychrolactophilus]
MANPVLAAAAGRVARRYMAGTKASDALSLIAANTARGHLTSIECAGESVRSEEVANSESKIFLSLISDMKARGEHATVSFDLSHVGSVVSPELGLDNALSMATAAREAGTHLMISAEGSARTDLVFGPVRQNLRRIPGNWHHDSGQAAPFSRRPQPRHAAPRPHSSRQGRVP